MIRTVVTAVAVSEEIILTNEEKMQAVGLVLMVLLLLAMICIALGLFLLKLRKIADKLGKKHKQIIRDFRNRND